MKGKPRDVQIKILATKAERKRLGSLATKEGRSLSRFLVMAGMERGTRKQIEAKDGVELV